MKIEKFPTLCRISIDPDNRNNINRRYYLHNGNWECRAYLKHPRYLENRHSYKYYTLKDNSIVVITSPVTDRWGHSYDDRYKFIPFMALINGDTPIRALDRWTSGYRYLPSILDTDLKPLFDDEPLIPAIFGMDQYI